MWNGKYYIGDSNNKPKQLYINRYETFQAGDILLSTTQPSSDWALCNGSETTTPIAGLKKPDIYNTPWTTSSVSGINIINNSNSFVSGGKYYLFSNINSSNTIGYIKSGSCNFTSSDIILPPTNMRFNSTIWTINGSDFMGLFQSSSNSNYYFLIGKFNTTQFVETYSIPILQSHITYIKPQNVMYVNPNELYLIMDGVYYKYNANGFVEQSSFGGTIYACKYGFYAFNTFYYFVLNASTIDIYTSIAFNTSYNKVFTINSKNILYLFYSDNCVILFCDKGNIIIIDNNNIKQIEIPAGGYSGYNKELNVLFITHETTTSTLDINTKATKKISSLNSSVENIYYYNHRYSAINSAQYKYINDNKYKLPLIDVDQTLQAQAYIKIK